MKVVDAIAATADDQGVTSPLRPGNEDHGNAAAGDSMIQRGLVEHTVHSEMVAPTK